MMEVKEFFKLAKEYCEKNDLDTCISHCGVRRYCVQGCFLIGVEDIEEVLKIIAPDYIEPATVVQIEMQPLQIDCCDCGVALGLSNIRCKACDEKRQQKGTKQMDLIICYNCNKYIDVCTVDTEEASNKIGYNCPHCGRFNLTCDIEESEEENR